MKKRIVSILLTLCMVLCLVPTAVFAEAAPTGTALTQESIKKLESYGWYVLEDDTYYLSEDVTLDLPLDIKGAVTLDMNGHALELGGKYIRCIGSNELTLTDSNSSVEHKFRVEDSGLWVRDEENGTKTVKGGVITGGESYITSSGYICGGVYVDGNSTFTMSGGSIVGCTAAGDGGGVSVDGNSTFTMKSGGSIVGCTAAGDGGGVYVSGNRSVSFTMEDGSSITDCTARRGGGVYTTLPSFSRGFTMNGGSITSCTADWGGGVYVYSEMDDAFTYDNAAFTMNGGTISSCTAGGAANAVHADGSFTDNSTAKIDKSLVTGINAGHEGTEDDPILIGSALGLENFRDRVNKGETRLCAKLTADIVFNNKVIFYEDGTWNGEHGDAPTEWTPIGRYKSNSDKATYAGTFDGNGKTVKGLYVNVENDLFAGLFGYTDGATIRNVTVDGFVIISGDFSDSSVTTSVGGIAACAKDTSITGCTNLCTVISSSSAPSGSYTGGIVGNIVATGNTEHSVTNCRNGGKVILKSGIEFLCVGGIAGFAGVPVSGCYNTGDIKAASNGRKLGDFHVGGVVGAITVNSVVDSCYNTGKVAVEGDFTVSEKYDAGFGGIVGICMGDDTVSNCYNVGKVTYTGSCEKVSAGGIAGVNHGSTVTDCCYLTGTVPSGVGSTFNNGTEKNTEARSKTQFAGGDVLALLKQNDMTGAWGECGYLAAAGMTLPLLSWQKAVAHIICTPEDASRWESDESGHWQVCSCGLIVNRAAHSGTATCTEQATCRVCLEKYGAKNANNHTGTSEWTQTSTTHMQKYKCCDKIVVNVENHKWENGICTKCHYHCAHTGGTATCKDNAICKVRGENYGEFNEKNHTGLKHTDSKKATAAENGNIEYWYCSGCDEYFSDENGTNKISKSETLTDKLAPEMILGKDAEIIKGEKKEIVFKSNAAFEDFIRVELDGKILDEKNYTTTRGSIIVTLNNDFVSNLSIGKHTIGIVSESGTATAELTVKENLVSLKSPKTGEYKNNEVLYLSGIILFSVFTIASLFLKKKAYHLFH